MTSTTSRLAAIRGSSPPTTHNARTIAALTTNPGCARRSVLDAAAIDKDELAKRIGHPSGFGLSTFAITRGNAFEDHVKANGCAELLRLLRDRLALPIPEVGYEDLKTVAGRETQKGRYHRSVQLLDQAARDAEGASTLYDHPLLQMTIGGQPVYLEPDIVAFRLHDQFYVVEIKSFPVIDGQGDARKVASAATQSAVYVLALREVMERLGHDPQIVSHEVFLVCPEDFSNRPTAARLDVRKQLTVVRRQLARLASVDALAAALPDGLSLDLGKSPQDWPRSAAQLIAALDVIEARYTPECLGSCEMARYCRRQAQGSTAALGRTALEELGGIDTVDRVLALASGDRVPDTHETEATALLRSAESLRRQCLDGVA